MSLPARIRTAQIAICQRLAARKKIRRHSRWARDAWMGVYAWMGFMDPLLLSFCLSLSLCASCSSLSALHILSVSEDASECARVYVRLADSLASGRPFRVHHYALIWACERGIVKKIIGSTYSCSCFWKLLYRTFWSVIIVWCTVYTFLSS